MADSKGKTTTDHDEIRRWIEERGGRPCKVKGTETKADNKSGESALLRVDFGKPEDKLEEIPWDGFFEIFDENGLAFLYQEETSGGKESRFFKFVRR